MDREEFMSIVYDELYSDGDNNRANRIIDAADEYAESAQLGTDCISRHAAIDAFDGVKVDEENCTEYDIGYNDGIDFVISKLSVLPPAQPEQRKKILYRHYKGGTYEFVCNNVTHTETGESLVVYRDCRWRLWARPEWMFYGLVKVGDDIVPRFVLCRSEGDAE